MQDEFVVIAAARPTVAVAGSHQRFPVRRIFCVGRNYPEHAREMGAKDHRAPPFFFTKPADAVMAAGSAIPYPSRIGTPAGVGPLKPGDRVLGGVDGVGLLEHTVIAR